MPSRTRKGHHCAPGRGRHGGTCFTPAELRRIATAWNKGHADQAPIATHPRRSGGALWHDIDAKMRAECTNEYCWTQRPTLTRHDPAVGGALAAASFRPAAPASWRANPNEWLSTTDIQTVLAQYEHAHPGFKFVGAVPVDFASPADHGGMGQCVVQELCAVDVQRWADRDVRQLGIVFNMDAHDEPGSHWTSLYADFDANLVLYYDSFGDRPPPEVQSLMDTLAVQLEARHGVPATVRANETRHQFHNTECGVYSIYFVAQMLEHRQAGFGTALDAYASYVSDGLNDKQMNRYRRVFFRTLYGDEKGGSGGLVGGGRRRRSRRKRQGRGTGGRRRATGTRARRM